MLQMNTFEKKLHFVGFASCFIVQACVTKNVCVEFDTGKDQQNIFLFLATINRLHAFDFKHTTLTILLVKSLNLKCSQTGIQHFLFCLKAKENQNMT